MNACFSGENRAPRTDYMFGFTVRHTPPKRIYVWVHGATQPTQWICVWLHSATHPGLRPPLSERGWRGSDLLIIKTMRQPIPSPHHQTPLIWGVSHYQTPTIPGCVALSNWLSVESCQSVVGSDSSSFNGYAAIMNLIASFFTPSNYFVYICNFNPEGWNGAKHTDY